MPDEPYRVPFGQANVLREGTDVTLIGYSGSVHQALRAATTLAAGGHRCRGASTSARCAPLDIDAIVASVRKTNRAVVVEDDWRFGGFGGEIAAIIQEQAFDYLDAPVLRVSGADVPMPYNGDAGAGRAAARGGHRRSRRSRRWCRSMPMISEVVMPQMGADMTEGTVLRWLKHEGDQVERGEIIAEIETDKANVEIEAFEARRLPQGARATKATSSRRRRHRRHRRAGDDISQLRERREGSGEHGGAASRAAHTDAPQPAAPPQASSRRQRRR